MHRDRRGELIGQLGIAGVKCQELHDRLMKVLDIL